MDEATLTEPKQQNLFEAPPEPTPWEAAAESDRLAAQVVFNRPLETSYSYLVPDSLRDVVGPGQRVRVPFGKGNRLTVGYCVGVGPLTEGHRQLKSLDAVLDLEPLIPEKMLELSRWIAERCLCGWGQVLDTIIPAGVKKQAGTRMVKFYRATPGVAEQLDELKLSAKQRAVLAVLCSENRPLRVDEITQAADCGTAPLKALREKGLIQASRERTEEFELESSPVTKDEDLTLNREQQNALQSILSSLRAAEHRTFLLHGVTGSGKTEVYIQAIREVVAYGRQAIVLVPEISLTPQTIRRFRARFDSVAVLHSHLSDVERHWHWQRIARGAVQVIVGARSAVFAPTPHLGLIIIDEEHETSFKQDTTPRYHAREVARERARLENVPLVLGSATPTLESWLRVKQRQDSLLVLTKRVEERPLPPVIVVDVRNDPQISRGAAIGRALEMAMRSALDNNGQIILFLNLRGYSPTLWCRGCGQSIKCPDCDITLTWHKDRGSAVCHSCDYATSEIRCSGCGNVSIRYLGNGTQRLEHEVRAKFPHHKCLRMDSDSMRRHGSHDAALEAFRHGDVDILLGTQMIAKGLDFPNVTLVGVVDADTILHQPDLRAAERTFQLISQVSGRTGRGARGGRVFVQSSSPTEPAILKAAEHDYRGFVENELQHRQELQTPPFRRLTRVILRGRDEATVRKHAQEMAGIFREVSDSNTNVDVRILGPAPAPVAKLKGLYRYHFQLTASRLSDIQWLWHEVSERIPKSVEVEYVVDVDPINMR